MAHLIPRTSNYANILETFTKKEREVYEKICAMLREEVVQEIRGRYRIALFIHKVYNEAKSKTSLYNQHFLERLAQALGYKSATPFREMLIVVERWPSMEVLEQEVLSKFENEITWKKIVFIARVDDEQERNEIMEDFAKGVRESQIREERKKLPVRSGRRVSEIETIDELLAEIPRHCASARRRITAWLEFETARVLEKIYLEEPKAIVEEYVQKLQKSISALEDLESDIHYLINSLRTAESVVPEFLPNNVEEEE